MNFRNSGFLCAVVIVFALLIAPLASQAAPLQESSAGIVTDDAGALSTTFGQLWSQILSFLGFGSSGAAVQAAPRPQDPSVGQPTSTDLTTVDQAPTGDSGPQIDPVG